MSLLVQLQQKPERLSGDSSALRDYIKKIKDAKELRDSRSDPMAFLRKQREKMGIEEK